MNPGAPNIQTERLLLRPFRESDAPGVHEYLATPPADCFAAMVLPSLEAARAEMRRRAASPELRLAIERKSDGRILGEIEAVSEPSAPDDPDAPHDTYSPCWMLNPAYRGRGYAREAARAFFDYLFTEKAARRIYAYVAEGNHPSRRLCESLGMRREGLFLEYATFTAAPDGTPLYENTLQYAILSREWPPQWQVTSGE